MRKRRLQQSIAFCLILVLVGFGVYSSISTQGVNANTESRAEEKVNTPATETVPDETVSTQASMEPTKENAATEASAETKDATAKTQGAIQDSLRATAKMSAKTNVPPEVQAVINALGGATYAEMYGGDTINLLQSATVSNKNLAIPNGYKLQINNDQTLTIEKTSSVTGNIRVVGGGTLILNGSFPNGTIGLDKGAEVIANGKLPEGRVTSELDLLIHENKSSGKTHYIGIYEADQAYVVRGNGNVEVFSDLADAINESESGDTVYLLRSITYDTKQDPLMATIQEGVTVIVGSGKTLTLGYDSMLYLYGTGSAGILRAEAGGVVKIPLDGVLDIPFVGVEGDDDAKIQLLKGNVDLKFPGVEGGSKPVEPKMLASSDKGTSQAMATRQGKEKIPLITMGKNAQGILSENQTLKLILADGPIDNTMDEGAKLTVKGTLSVMSGTANENKSWASVLTLKENSNITSTTEGKILLMENTTSTIEKGATLSMARFDDNNDLYIQGNVFAKAGANLILENKKIIGGQDALLQVNQGSVMTNLQNKSMVVEENSKMTVNDKWNFGLTSGNTGKDYLDKLKIENGSQLIINNEFTLSKGKELENNGEIIVGPKGKLIIKDGNDLANNGKITVLPGGEIEGNGSFMLKPFADKVFPAQTEGYSEVEKYTVAAYRNGPDDTGDLKVSLNGKDADSFKLEPEGSIGNPVRLEKDVEFSVSPKLGLKAGTYTAAVTVNNGRVFLTFNVQYTVNAIQKHDSAAQSTKDGKGPKGNAVQTSDPGQMTGYLLLILAAICAGSMAFIRRKQK